jgi:hypothetical protein
LLSRCADLDILGTTTALVRDYDLASLKPEIEGLNVVANALGLGGQELKDLIVRAVANTSSVSRTSILNSACIEHEMAVRTQLPSSRIVQEGACMPLLL